jgi:hypothetical protein
MSPILIAAYCHVLVAGGCAWLAAEYRGDALCRIGWALFACGMLGMCLRRVQMAYPEFWPIGTPGIYFFDTAVFVAGLACHGACKIRENRRHRRERGAQHHEHKTRGGTAA